MSGYPQLKAFCILPVAEKGWSYESDPYGRMLVRFPDPRQALGAVRFKAYDGDEVIPLTYRAYFMLAGGAGVRVSNPVQYPTFAPERSTDCQFLKAIQIDMPEQYHQRYSVEVSGVVSYYRQNHQTAVGPVRAGDGRWLGMDREGPFEEWLSSIQVTIARRMASEAPSALFEGPTGEPEMPGA